MTSAWIPWAESSQSRRRLRPCGDAAALAAVLMFKRSAIRTVRHGGEDTSTTGGAVASKAVGGRLAETAMPLLGRKPSFVKLPVRPLFQASPARPSFRASLRRRSGAGRVAVIDFARIVAGMPVLMPFVRRIVDEQRAPDSQNQGKSDREEGEGSSELAHFAIARPNLPVRLMPLCCCLRRSSSFGWSVHSLNVLRPGRSEVECRNFLIFKLYLSFIFVHFRERVCS